eukprot:COSAG02_NODE_30_length_50867_cov_66.594331_17_plen_282_part_00
MHAPAPTSARGGVAISYGLQRFAGTFGGGGKDGIDQRGGAICEKRDAYRPLLRAADSLSVTRSLRTADGWPPLDRAPHDTQVFDLCGFTVIKNVLSEEEVDELNAAIDHYLPIVQPQAHASMAPNAPAMMGESNVNVKIATRLSQLRGIEAISAGEVLEQLKGAGFPPQNAERDTKGRAKVADADALAAALAVITLGGVALSDTEQAAAMEVADPNDAGEIRMGVGRTDLGGMLQWEHPWCDPFRRLLVNEAVKPYLLTLLGSGYRMVSRFEQPPQPHSFV